MPPVEVIVRAPGASLPSASQVRSRLSFCLPALPSTQPTVTPSGLDLHHTMDSVNLDVSTTYAHHEGSTEVAGGAVDTNAMTSTSRRKPHTTSASPSGDSASGSSVRPSNAPILARCVAFSSSRTAASPSPVLSASASTSTSPLSRTSTSAVVALLAHVRPYEPLLDRANTRSVNPSPKEVARAARLEAERVRARVDAAALARAAIANKRRRGKTRASSRVPSGAEGAMLGGGVGGGTSEEGGPGHEMGNDAAGNRSRGGSPVAQGSEGLRIAQGSPVIGNGQPSTHTLLRPTVGMKRTRSQGLVSISPAAANAHTNGLAVGSPLRSVIGAGNTEAAEDGDEADEHGRRKKSRLSDSDRDTLGTVLDAATRGRKQSASSDTGMMEAGHAPAHITLKFGAKRGASTSPYTLPKELPGAAASGDGLLRPPTLGKVGRSTSSTAAGLRDLAGGTDMRRVASASGLGKAGAAGRLEGSLGNRRRSSGSDSLAGDRARREKTIPAHLRDYDVKVAVA